MRVRPFTLALVVGLMSCREYAMSNDTDADYSDSGADADVDVDMDTDADADTDADVAEDEDEFFTLRPAQTDRYVFIANPARDTLTRVDVDSLEVRTAPVGHDPNLVLTTPDQSTAVVFNRGDDTISIIDAATFDQRVVQVRDDLNRMVMSPDGRWVALFHDTAAERPDDPPADGVQSYNEVSFVDLVDGTHFGMAVDYRPREVQFTPDSSLATVVTATSLGLVDLTARPLLPRLVPLTDELVDPPTAEEVAVAPDGSFAFVRQFGAEDLVLVDLDDESITAIDVGSNPTDLDITPDGQFAVVVSRGDHKIRVFDLSDPLAPPEEIALPPDVALGSVALDPTGRRAVVYTTATLTDRFATWDVDSGEVTLRQLVKPVRSLAITPDGLSVLVFHTQGDAAEANRESPFFGAWALSTISLSDYRQNPLWLPNEPIGFANSSSGRYGYFILRNTRQVTQLDYQTLLPEEVPLKSLPVFVGVLPDDSPDDGIHPRAWVSQQHDLGRITLYDPNDASVQTITGFELNSAIEE